MAFNPYLSNPYFSWVKSNILENSRNDFPTLIISKIAPGLGLGSTGNGLGKDPKRIRVRVRFRFSI